MIPFPKLIAATSILLAAAPASAVVAPAVAAAAPNSAVQTSATPQIKPTFRIGAGNGAYIYLTQREQQTVVAGGGAGIAAAVCGSTAGLACAGASAAMAAAATYVSSRGGICPGELELRITGPTTVIPKCM